jgi:hypothetical protein
LLAEILKNKEILKTGGIYHFTGIYNFKLAFAGGAALDIRCRSLSGCKD